MTTVGLPPKVISDLTVVDEQTEVANNGYRDGFSGLNNTEESFRNDGPSISGNFPRIDLRMPRRLTMLEIVDQRKMNAVRAYFEWMPIR